MTGADVSVSDRTATRRFLAALYRSAPADSLVEVRYSVASGMRQRFGRVEEVEGVVDEVAGRARSTDVFVGVVPRRRHGGRRDDLVARTSVVWVDCDSHESVAALAGFRPRPAIEVASGSRQNRHAYWVLRDAVGLDAIELLNRRLALELGADARCSDAARILRPAGSINWKSGRPTAVRLIALDEQRSVDVAELDRRLPALPAEPAAPAEARRWSPRAAGEDRLLAVSPRVYVERLTGAPVGRSGKMRCPFHELSVGDTTADDVSPACSVEDASLNGRAAGDRLLSIPPPVYFERLTGLRVGRSGKLHCLFHDDRSPSLHVYREPERGWYCFGCQRGGSVYDLGALLLGRGTRGRDFVELRRELEQRLL
jgi:hypothetical protein